MVSALFPLSVAGLTVRRRGKAILGPLDVEFGPSGLTMVIGPNGAGKTTLLKSLYGIERPSAGDIRWSASEAKVQARQAYVFQTPTMLRRTVRENLAYPLRLVGMNRAEIHRRCERWAERIGLSVALDRRAPRLSGGERQKLALARALIRNPDALFLDEPCANLDTRSTAEIEAILSEVQAAGTRIVMTSHNVGQIRRLATDYVFLLDGQLRSTGDADALGSPDDPALAAFLGGELVP